MARCCSGIIPNEFTPCYASALVYGTDTGLRDKLQQMEQEGIHPCFTAWCSTCSNTYMLCSDVPKFFSPSAHHTHKLALLDLLKAEGIYMTPIRKNQIIEENAYSDFGD